MGARENCWAAGRGWDPIGGVCVTRSGKAGVDALQYWDPVSGLLMTSPPIAVGGEAQIQWAPPADAPLPVRNPQVLPALQVNPLGGIGDFLMAPSILGLPTWAVIALLAGGVGVLIMMDGGTSKKKGGLF